MWKDIGSKGQVDRLECWGFILANDELARIMGKGDRAKGKTMLETMKAMRSLDTSGDGIIYTHEFQRLYLPSVILAAEDAVKNSIAPSYLLDL